MLAEITQPVREISLWSCRLLCTRYAILTPDPSPLQSQVSTGRHSIRSLLSEFSGGREAMSSLSSITSLSLQSKVTRERTPPRHSRPRVDAATSRLPWMRSLCGPKLLDAATGCARCGFRSEHSPHMVLGHSGPLAAALVSSAPLPY